MSAPEERHGAVEIWRCPNDEEAEIVLGFLSENGIDAVLDSSLPHGMFPVSGDSVILVHEDDAEAARQLLDDAQRGGADAAEGDE